MKNTKIIALSISLLAIATLWFYIRPQKPDQLTQEKVLVIASNSQIQTLDPIQAGNNYTINELAKIYEGLLAYHYLKRPYELVPNLAEDIPTVSADKLVYTFKIRQGVRLHDNPCFSNGEGRELTAHDFVYSFKRLADPKLQSAEFWVIDGKIKGLNEWREKYANMTTVDYTEKIDGLEAIDRYTLKFTLTHPYPQFLYVLTKVSCGAVPYEAVQHYGKEFPNHPVGTGPFMLSSFSPQDSKYEQAVVMPDSPARTNLYEKLNQMAAEQVPVIYVIHNPSRAIYQGWVKNYTLTDCIFNIEQYIDIDLEKKQAHSQS